MLNDKYWLCCAVLALQGCNTSHSTMQNLPDYLQRIIGQSSSSIQQHLNLKPLGFQTLAQPQQNKNQLIYTVIRPIRIPIPIAQSAHMPAQSIPIQTAVNTSQAYDIHFNCHIIFELDQQQIARSIRYEGKAC